MIPQSFIDELLARLDVVDVIGQHVPLKKAGQNYVACCPFHQEKTPSFSVSPQKQFYYCFGCGAHGSSLGFIMQHLGLSFVEAVTYLAQSLGMSVPQTLGGSHHHIKTTLPKSSPILEEVTHFYQRYLSERIVSDYLRIRGLSESVIHDFSLGYAPEEWQNLLPAFPNQSTSLHEHGLLIEHPETGRIYDRFRGRLMFPIRNIHGHVIGFGGRTLGNDKPKYLNSPETSWFDKSKTLYGLFEAKSHIRSKSYAIVVEGYMDVIALAQHNLGCAVATLGTSISDEHVRVLLRTTDVLYVCFDGDIAGHKAAWRAMGHLLSQIKDYQKAYFSFLPEGHDPDSWVRQYGGEAFELWMKKESIPLSEYMLQGLMNRYPPHTTEDKAALLHELRPLISTIQAPILKALVAQMASDRLGFDLNVLERIQVPHATPKKASQQKTSSYPRSHRPQVMRLEHLLLQCLVHYPELAHDVVFPDSLELNEPLNDLSIVAHYVASLDEPPSFPQLLEYVNTLPCAERLQSVLKQSMQHQETIPERGAAKIYLQEGLDRAMKGLYRQQLQQLMFEAKQRSLTHQERLLLSALLQNSK